MLENARCWTVPERTQPWSRLSTILEGVYFISHSPIQRPAGDKCNTSRYAADAARVRKLRSVAIPSFSQLNAFSFSHFGEGTRARTRNSPRADPGQCPRSCQTPNEYRDKCGSG